MSGQVQRQVHPEAAFFRKRWKKTSATGVSRPARYATSWASRTPKGQRVSYLQAYLQGLDAGHKPNSAMDAAPARRPGNFLDRHLNKGA